MTTPPKSFEPLNPGEARTHLYEVGTLKYTKKDLVKLFVLLLGGDFVLVFFESIFGPFGTLYSQKFHASNALISMMMNSVPGFVNVFFGPSISRWSDNFRGPWGRRIPFLAASIPMVFISIVVMGFSPEVAGIFYNGGLHRYAPSIVFDNVVLTVLTSCVVLFHLGNMILLNSYAWLQRDVIPQELMARFLSWFRIVGIVSGALFSWYIFPHAIDDRKVICLSLGAFYLIVFGLMCRNVKEGNYPPPVEQKGNPVQLYLDYFRQCFSVRIYRLAFIMRMLAGMSVCAYTFMIFFQTETIGMSLDHLGKLTAVTSIVSALILLPIGWLCDKFSPFRVQFICAILGLVFTVLSYFLNVSEYTLILFSFITLPQAVAGGLAGNAVIMELFPSQKFGQFFAAGNIMGMGIKIVGAAAFGYYLDYLHSNYRMIYVWCFFWDSMGLVVLYLFYSEWRRLGGPKNYVPPLPPE